MQKVYQSGILFAMLELVDQSDYIVNRDDLQESGVMKYQCLKLRIDRGDLDLLGHVNNVSIVRYLQAGRVMFMEKVGLPAYVGMKTGPIEAATEIQFRKQLHFPGNVEVRTKVREVKNTSIILDHQIYDEAGELAVSAMEVIVYFDFVNQTKIPLTDQLRQNIAAYSATLPEL